MVFTWTFNIRLSITRTIWVSCLSHFLLLLLHSRQICNGTCTRTRASARNYNPAPLLISGSETTSTATLRLCPFTSFLQPRQLFGHLAKLYRDRSCIQLNLYHDGKKCAIPSLHRDNFLAKEPGLCPVLASGNTTSPYCRAVSFYLSRTLHGIKMNENLYLCKTYHYDDSNRT